jgi:hypothetical protein
MFLDGHMLLLLFGIYQGVELLSHKVYLTFVDTAKKISKVVILLFMTSSNVEEF